MKSYEMTGYRGGIENTLSFERKIGLGIREEGAPYVTGSTLRGVCFDGGIDMGRTPVQVAWECFDPFLDNEETLSLYGCSGLFGDNALKMLQINQTLADIRIPYDASLIAMQASLAPVWAKIVQRWPTLKAPTCPDFIQESVLDLVWCRGIMNGHVKMIGRSLNSKNWLEAAELMAEMQQRAKDKLVVERRAFFANFALEQL